MSDDVDIAQGYADGFTAGALAAHQRGRGILDEGGDGTCIDCGERIPARRLAAKPGALRCQTCQRDHERRR